MSKAEMKELAAYKRWLLNFVVVAVICGIYFVVMLCLSIDLFVTMGNEATVIFLGLIIPVIIFSPFCIYYGAKMLNLRMHIADYKKIQVSITNAESTYFGVREGGVYDCAAHYKDTDTKVHFQVYMRYCPHGIELEQGRIVEVWYNPKTDAALFANKVK